MRLANRPRAAALPTAATPAFPSAALAALPIAFLAWGLALPPATAQEPTTASVPATEAPIGTTQGPTSGTTPAAAPETAPVQEPVPVPEPLPDAPALLRRALAAHKALGPATIVTTMTGTYEGEPMTITVTTSRNDAAHFAASASARLGRITLEEGIWQWYRNGAKEIFYDGTDNRYYHNYGAGPFPPDLMGAFLAEFDPASLTPKKGSKAAIRVTAVEIGGRPAYEVIVPGLDARGNQSSASRMAFDREDSLIREFRFADSSGAFDVTVAYTLEEKPFPEATFVFSPPRGAREVKPAAKPPAKTTAKKAPPKKPARKAPPSRLPRR